MRRKCGYLIAAVLFALTFSCQNAFVGETIEADAGAASKAAAPAWPVLNEDDKGAIVDALQYFLIAWGHSVAVDGDFGPATKNAVMAFQSKKGLTVDGIVGTNTWQKLIKEIKEGDSGGHVKALQYLLRYKFEYGSVSVDGEFGSSTVAAVKKFKDLRGLSGGTVVGATTWLYLIGGSAIDGGGGGPADGKWHIKISLPSNRWNYGTLRLYDNKGKQLLSASCLGRSVSNASMYVHRGNTPTGKYTGYLYGPASPRESYGPYKVVAMNGVSGAIVASGRSGIWIHGGRSQTTLSATYGCVRVFENTQYSIQSNIQALINKGVPSVGIIDIVEY